MGVWERERNQQIWDAYFKGVSVVKLADLHNLSRQRIHDILDEIRAEIPEEEVDKARKRSLDLCDYLMEKTVELIEMGPVPVISAKGTIVEDPTTGSIVVDYSTRVNAIGMALKVSERYHRIIGADAPKKYEHDHLVSEAVQQQAEGALGKLRLVANE